MQNIGCGAFHRPSDADAAVERQELDRAQTLNEPSIAGEDDSQQDVGIQLRGGQQTQFGQDLRGHLLNFIAGE